MSMVLSKAKDASIKLRSWLSTMGDRLPLTRDFSQNSMQNASESDAYTSLAATISASEQDNLLEADNAEIQPSSSGAAQNTSNNPEILVRQSASDYTELMGGSVPCPSCRGSGRIPKELEGTLVALIPVSDKRLKPRRTWLYVSLAVIFCIVIAAVLLFFLLPRSLLVDSLQSPITNVRIVRYKKDKLLELNFFNPVNLSNYNYFYVRAVEASGQMVNRFQPWNRDILGSGVNLTGISIAPRASNAEMLVNYTLKLDANQEFMVRYCSGIFSQFHPVFIRVEFDVTVTFQYLNRREQDTHSSVQDVCCVPSGNCTY